MSESDAPVGLASTYPGGGQCEQCGMGTFIDEEGKTACEGCRKPTDRCACQTSS